MSNKTESLLMSSLFWVYLSLLRPIKAVKCLGSIMYPMRWIANYQKTVCRRHGKYILEGDLPEDYMWYTENKLPQISDWVFLPIAYKPWWHVNLTKFCHKFIRYLLFVQFFFFQQLKAYNYWPLYYIFLSCAILGANPNDQM